MSFFGQRPPSTWGDGKPYVPNGSMWDKQYTEITNKVLYTATTYPVTPKEEVIQKEDVTIKPNPVRKTKAKIPSAVRKIVWNTYIGKDIIKGKCLCCNAEELTGTNFECGHVKSEKNGGEITIDNLRPICSNCNKSIGSKDIDEFMTRYKIKQPKNWNGII